MLLSAQEGSKTRPVIRLAAIEELSTGDIIYSTRRANLSCRSCSVLSSVVPWFALVRHV
jgi:hypothetical protein